jgi:succinate-semialdehyde dehydrogenase/glutarate-semialdehyde dehydrogenase
MNLQLHSIIDNRDEVGKDGLVSTNPATETEIATASKLDAHDARRAVDSARGAFSRWSQTPVERRQKILSRWLEIMLEEEEELSQLVSLEGGKPVAEARLVDVFPGLETLSYYAKNLDKLLRFRPVRPNQLLFAHWRAGYRLDPLGVIAVITPWNYPVGIPIWSLVPTLGAGNAVVFKPASATVLTGLKIADMARRAGLPDGVLNTVVLPGSATDIIVDHPDVDKVLFTGSVEVGRHVGKLCADRLVPAQLELGGKDAAVVAADADLERTARGLVWGAFVNTGQTCASIERVYAAKEIYPQLVDRVVELARKIVTGDPSEADTDMGPLTTKGQLDSVAAQVESALAGGARAVTGGSRPEGPGYFYPPTVLVDVEEDMEVMREETFGPVLPIVSVSNLDEAIDRANGTRFGLTASGWTASAQIAERMERDLRAGVVMINEHAVAFAEVTGCWGGVGESGIGRSHGEHGLHEVVNIKYVARDSGGMQASPWYYPYGEDLDQFMAASMPLMYDRGLRRYRKLAQLMTNRRFRERVRKGSLVRHFTKLL